MKELNVMKEICEIIIGFLKAKQKFEDIFRKWQNEGSFDFALLDELEVDLYHLKNKTHTALRDTSEENKRILEKADLFDLMLGSIFHEALHLKEYVYTLRSYKPRYDSFSKRTEGRKLDSYSRDFLQHSTEILREAETNLPRKAHEVKNLFEDALIVGEAIIKKYRHNSRLIRTLYTSEKLIEKVYGADGLKGIYSRIYKNGVADGYYHAGLSFFREGFYDLALEAFEQSFAASDDSSHGILAEILKKCGLIQKKQPALAEKSENLIRKISKAA